MGGPLRGVGVFGSSAVALPFSRWVTVGISLRARDWKEIDRVKPEGGQDSASGAPQPQLCDGRQVLALKHVPGGGSRAEKGSAVTCCKEETEDQVCFMAKEKFSFCVCSVYCLQFLRGC